jgi:hypothetical protein
MKYEVATCFTSFTINLFYLITSCTRHALQCQSKTPFPLDIA